MGEQDFQSVRRISKQGERQATRCARCRRNARQGFFNGSRPPFGYRTVETEAIGSKGHKKKRLP
jgi:hypothetical protein